MKNQLVRCIYGAGKYGKLLYQCFADIGISIDYFVQTDEPDDKEINGISVISYKQLISMENDKIIFIAMNNEQAVKEIEKTILSSEYSGSLQLYDCKSFINDNLLRVKSFIKTDPTAVRQCIICGNSVDKFLASGIDEEIFKQHHIIGGGYRENCICPHCGAGDRIRWLYYVLKNKTDISALSGKILHFAPEGALVSYIKENKEIDYYTGDIVPGRAMHTTDITDIQYKDNIFDYVICNHVMEHITDEAKAVAEIKRVLKPNGKWIFSFPICTDMETYEDKTITSPKQRLTAYGQEDHVRLYGCDFAERFEKYGLKLHIYRPMNELDDTLIKKYGFIKDDVTIIAENIK